MSVKECESESIPATVGRCRGKLLQETYDSLHDTENKPEYKGVRSPDP